MAVSAVVMVVTIVASMSTLLVLQKRKRARLNYNIDKIVSAIFYILPVLFSNFLVLSIQ